MCHKDDSGRVRYLRPTSPKTFGPGTHPHPVPTDVDGISCTSTHGGVGTALALQAKVFIFLFCFRTPLRLFFEGGGGGALGRGAATGVSVRSTEPTLWCASGQGPKVPAHWGFSGPCFPKSSPAACRIAICESDVLSGSRRRTSSSQKTIPTACIYIHEPNAYAMAATGLAPDTQAAGRPAHEHQQRGTVLPVYV